MDSAVQLESYLKGLAKRRKTRRVSADDAHRFLDRQGVNGNRVSLINRVFNNASDSFKPVGTIFSERPIAKRRTITAWELVA